MVNTDCINSINKEGGPFRTRSKCGLAGSENIYCDGDKSCRDRCPRWNK